MSWTLDEIQAQIASIIDQTATAPSATSDDYALRRTLVNRALVDYGETYDWPHLLREFNSINIGNTVNSLTTIALPTDFRKLASYPNITWDGTNTSQFSQVDLTKVGQYSSEDKYLYILKSGPTYTAVIHSPTLASGASIYLSYYASPGSLASPTSATVCPDPTYLVQKALYYLYQATEDSRLSEADGKAEMILQRMLENEVVRGEAYADGRVKNWQETSWNFRIGRD